MAGGVVCALTNRGLDAEVAAALADHRDWTLVRRCVDLTEVRAVARAGTAAVAVISSEHRTLDARVIDDLRAHGMRLVGVAHDEPGERRLRQWRFEVVVSGTVDADSILAALDAAVLSDSATEVVAPAEELSPSTAPGGRMVAVWGPPGAPGRSTVALNLAAEWARAGSATLLVDADDTVGSLAQMAGVLDDHAGVLAAARAANQAGLDRPTLARLAPQIEEGFRLLTGATRRVRTPPPPMALEQLWSVARLLADVVVIDVGAADLGGTGIGASAVAEADQILVVGLPDPVALARLAAALQDLDSAGMTAKAHVVLNRVRRHGPWVPDLDHELSQWVAIEHLWQIRDDGVAADRAVAAGRPLASVAPRSQLREGIRDVRAGLAGEPRQVRRWRGRAHSPAAG